MIEAIDIERDIKIIKDIFFILITYYTNFKICNQNEKMSISKSLIVILLAIIYADIKFKSNGLICMVISIIVITVIYSKDNIKRGILTTITSMSINYIISALSIIIAFIFEKVIRVNNNYINLTVIIVSHLLLLLMLFKIKKFKYGFGFLQNSSKNDYIDIFILSISVIVLFFIAVFVNSNGIIGMNMAMAIPIFAIIMFITIQKSFQLYYKQKLLIKELDETKAELAKKAKEVEDLEAENISISKKSHTLSHKQKSLEYKLEQMASKAEISIEEAASVRDKLKEIEKDLYKEKTETQLSKTGIFEIDNMLEYMQAECKKNKIDFELQIKGNIHYMINNIISKEDLETLLADHIKNSIIAINHTDNVNRSILVRLGEIDGIYSLYIYDSGIEFEQQTLKNLGKKPSTTHKDEGGTGMGFMNTFDTLRKYEASLTINELGQPSKENYTKAIIIKFDKKNDFQIISY